MVNAALNGSVYELVIHGMLGKIIDNDFDCKTWSV